MGEEQAKLIALESNMQSASETDQDLRQHRHAGV